MLQCKECQHEDVCKYKEEYKNVFDKFKKKETPDFITIDIKCNKFQRFPEFIPYIPNDKKEYPPYDITWDKGSVDV
ncbi:MAG: hypothetical protein ACOCRO_06575 [Halanaerobiales bacterium]